MRGPGAARARRALRGWRCTRPFWAGALLILAGAELLAVPLAPWRVLLGLGLGGIAALGIGAALTAAGLFLWLLPHTRHYVGIHAVILAVVSFAASNLGGFFVGALLGIAGGAMGFAWTPGTPQDGPAPGEATHDGPALDRPAPDRTARERAVLDGPAPEGATAPAAPSVPPPPPPGSPPKALAAALPVVLLASVAVPPQATPATNPTRATRTVAGPPQVAPAANPAPAPAPAPGSAPAAPTPPTVSTTRFTPTGFTLSGVEQVDTAHGPLKVIVLRMRAASLARYRLRTHDGGDEYALDVADLRLSGDVTLYLTRFSGCVQGLVCLTFTPDTLPVPPVVPPFVFMTDVDAEQALVTSDTITAGGLRLAAIPPGGRPPPP
ncbi:DUF6114 domain-containing protein [Streptomyces sp. SCA3-4]|uniref:DUF6114 domain-containing protein n=1 Tax=Streptomyces sichuanensis TaxID=2871810 RepID=UPI001CE32663|nr:DUF6114 domain-containing protein [Streptomyces sichuanensis]MCA6092171.1 DUF6114 domain-containing protein [Streptomyces sichuanensis]